MLNHKNKCLKSYNVKTKFVIQLKKTQIQNQIFVYTFLAFSCSKDAGISDTFDGALRFKEANWEKICGVWVRDFSCKI